MGWKVWLVLILLVGGVVGCTDAVWKGLTGHNLILQDESDKSTDTSGSNSNALCKSYEDLRRTAIDAGYDGKAELRDMAAEGCDMPAGATSQDTRTYQEGLTCKMYRDAGEDPPDGC